MPLASSVWILVALTTPVRSPPVAPATVCAKAGDMGEALTELGPVQAPIGIDAYLDPTDATSLTTWLELRRLVADQAGALGISVHWVRSPGPVEPRADAVRAWVVATSRRGGILPALRLVSRDGPDRLFVRLHEPRGGEELARDLDLRSSVLPDTEAVRCARQGLLRTTDALRRRHSGNRSGVYRLPVFAVDDLVFEGSPTLDRLRWELARHGQRAREARDRPPAPVPEPKAASARMRRPPLRGLVLGGIGLPHRFVLMARDEDDPNLGMLLPPLLEFRRAHPGVLSVQVVARGSSLGGQRLRHRLCASRRSGLGLDYARFLAMDPSRRRFPSVREESLLEQLDAVDEEACSEEPDPGQLGLPDGGWLDGIVRNRSELENLDTTLRLLDAASRPLSAVLAPPRDDDL